LQRRIGIGKPKRFGAVFLGLEGVDLSVDPAIDRVSENELVDEPIAGTMIFFRLADQLR